jgi:hypothetical protein
MKITEIDLWSVLGKVAGIGAFAILAYRTLYPDGRPDPPQERWIEPTGRVQVEEAIPAYLPETAPQVSADPMGWDFTRSSETTGTDGLPQNTMILMHNTLVGGNWNKSLEDAGVPADILDVVIRHVDGAQNRAFLTALAWQETRYNDKKIRAASGDDAGHSKGPWQVHDHWARITAKDAAGKGNHTDSDAILAGISEDLSKNLIGVRALLRVQKEWRGPGGYHDIASYYNEGTAWAKPKGQRYADLVMGKYAELLPIFQSQY